MRLLEVVLGEGNVATPYRNHMILLKINALYKVLGFEGIKRNVRPEYHDTIVWRQGNGKTLEMYIDSTHPKRLTNPEAIRKDSFTGEKLFFVKDHDGLPVEVRE